MTPGPRALGRLLLAGVALLPLWAAAETTEWRFEARLDGRLIGQHQFTLQATGQQRQLLSQAGFSVRVLGLEVYRYEHQAQEQWDGNCLRGMNSRTSDGGRASRVLAQTVGEGANSRLRVSTDGEAKPQELEGCIMGFAYWNPALPTQRRLLNVQTGKLEDVRIERAPDGQLDLRGTPVAARRWRIHAQEQTIDVWYAAGTGDWIGLDAQVSGRRQLSYRLVASGEPNPAR
jgi:hypothetical protein